MCVWEKRDSQIYAYEQRSAYEQSLTFNGLTEYFRVRHMAFAEEEKRKFELFCNDGTYSNLGYILSDQWINSIKVALFHGCSSNKIVDRADITGSVLVQQEHILKFLSKHNRLGSSTDQQTQTVNFPSEAVREAIVNASIHRDYGLNAPTLVLIFNDRLEIVSYGGLVNGVSSEDVLNGLSICRNPKLSKVFEVLGEARLQGLGMRTIVQAYENCCDKPEIKLSEHVFKIILPNLNGNSDVQGFTSREKQIYRYLSSHEFVTRPDVDKMLNISQPTASRLLRGMVDNGYLVAEGDARNTKYRRIRKRE